MGRANIQPADSADRVRELTWAMVDENLEDSQWSELQKLLTDSSSARFAYIEAMQLHTDLLFHFQDQHKGESKKDPDTPILGSIEASTAITSPTMGIGN